MPDDGSGGVRYQILSRTLKLGMRDGKRYKFRQGQIVYLQDVDPQQAILANCIREPRTGNEAVEKMIRAARKEGRDAKGRWVGMEEPVWYTKQLIPAWQPLD